MKLLKDNIFKPHPRSEKELNDLHEKSQRIFQNYVINQRSIRQQQQKMQVMLALANNDADLILSKYIHVLHLLNSSNHIHNQIDRLSQTKSSNRRRRQYLL